jgi:hypothetical protein
VRKRDEERRGKREEESRREKGEEERERGGEEGRERKRERRGERREGNTEEKRSLSLSLICLLSSLSLLLFSPSLRMIRQGLNGYLRTDQQKLTEKLQSLGVRPAFRVQWLLVEWSPHQSSDVCRNRREWVEAAKSGVYRKNGKTQASKTYRLHTTVRGEPVQFFNPEVLYSGCQAGSDLGGSVGKKRKASTKDCFPEHSNLENLIEVQVDARDFVQRWHLYRDSGKPISECDNCTNRIIRDIQATQDRGRLKKINPIQATWEEGSSWTNIQVTPTLDVTLELFWKQKPTNSMEFFCNETFFGVFTKIDLRSQKKKHIENAMCPALVRTQCYRPEQTVSDLI